MSIAKTIRMNQLFAFYQSLLTQKQQQMLELYYEEDYSLAEIATYYQISRQAVHDNLKRAENLLEDYETKLQLLARRQQRINLLEQLIELSKDYTDIQLLLKQIKQMDD